MPPKELIQQYQEKRASLNADIDRILSSDYGYFGYRSGGELMTGQQLKNSILQMASAG